MLVTRSRLCSPLSARAAPGFTLVELLATIALLAIIVALAVPGYQIFVERARRTQTIGLIGEIDLAINEFAVASNVGRLPDDLAAVGYPGAVDAWGGPIVYVNFALGGAPRFDQNGDPVNTAYDLYSSGRDGASAPSLTAAASQDDIVVASDGGYLGVVAEYGRLN